jgi:hypothetical protein
VTAPTAPARLRPRRHHVVHPVPTGRSERVTHVLGPVHEGIRFPVPGTPATSVPGPAGAAAGEALEVPVQFHPVYQRQRSRARQDNEGAVLAERVGRGAQVPHQLVGRGQDVHRGAAPGPAPQDLSAAERHAGPRGLGHQDPARGAPQRGSLKLSAVDDNPDVHAGHGNRGY